MRVADFDSRRDLGRALREAEGRGVFCPGRSLMLPHSLARRLRRPLSGTLTQPERFSRRPAIDDPDGRHLAPPPRGTLRRLICAAFGSLLLVALTIVVPSLAPVLGSAHAQEAGGADHSDSDLTRLGVSRGAGSERLVRGVRGLLRVRRQLAVTGSGELRRYRDAVDAYAQFLKRDNLAVAGEALRQARAAYERLDRDWIERMAARVNVQTGLAELSLSDAAALAEARAIAKEIAAALAQLNDLATERRRLEMELDRSYRNLIRLHEEARRIREELIPLSPPPAVIFLYEEIETLYATEVPPLRIREEGLRSLIGRLEDRLAERGRGARLQAIRAALGKIRAIERAFEGKEPADSRE